MPLHKQLSLFYSLGVDEVTEIFGTKELKREKELFGEKKPGTKLRRRTKIVDHSWDYTGTYTHCFHNYPAMMIPQIASRLIDTGERY